MGEVGGAYTHVCYSAEDFLLAYAHVFDTTLLLNMYLIHLES